MSHVSTISTPHSSGVSRSAYRIQDDLVLYGADPRTPASVICRTSDCLALLMRPSTGDIVLHGERQAVKAAFEATDPGGEREEACITIPATVDGVEGLNAILAHQQGAAPSKRRRMAP